MRLILYRLIKVLVFILVPPVYWIFSIISGLVFILVPPVYWIFSIMSGLVFILVPPVHWIFSIMSGLASFQPLYHINQLDKTSTNMILSNSSENTQVKETALKIKPCDEMTSERNSNTFCKKNGLIQALKSC